MLGEIRTTPPGEKDSFEENTGRSVEDESNLKSPDIDRYCEHESLEVSSCDPKTICTSIEEDDTNEMIYPGISSYSQTGKFRIIVVGDSGIGKTTLVKTFLSGPEILGTETVPSQMGTIEFSRGSTQMVDVDSKYLYLANSYSNPNAELVEDTKAGSDKGVKDYEEDHEVVSKQGNEESRKSLNYNLTFIDVPGFGMHVDAMNVIRPVIELLYIQYHQTNKYFNPKAHRLERFLISPNGAHTHVDVCLFGILHRVKGVDIEFMRHLSKVVNVVPLILKSDTLKKSEILELKLSTLKLIKGNNFSVYTFGKTIDELITLTEKGVLGLVPFAISSILDQDLAASTSKNVVSPSEYSERGGQFELISEFNILKTKMLLSHVNDLRYNNVLKFVKWREKLLNSKPTCKSSSSDNAENPSEKRQNKQYSLTKKYGLGDGSQSQLGFAVSSPSAFGYVLHNHANYTQEQVRNTDNHHPRAVKNLHVDTKPHGFYVENNQRSAANIFSTPVDLRSKPSNKHSEQDSPLNNKNLATHSVERSPSNHSHTSDNAQHFTLNKTNSKSNIVQNFQNKLSGVLSDTSANNSSSAKTAILTSNDLPNSHSYSSAPSSPVNTKDILSPEQPIKNSHKLKKPSTRHMGVIYSGSSPNLHQTLNPNKPPSLVGKVLGKFKSKRS